MRWRRVILLGLLALILYAIYLSLPFLLTYRGQPEPGLKQLTNYRYDTTNPSWSPDGQYLVFESRHESLNPDSYYGQDQDLFILNLSNRAIKRITYNARHKEDPVWSPDGQSIAFRWTNRRVCVVHIDGSQLYCLHVPGAKKNIAWSPDGQSLVYQTEEKTIHRLRMDGGKPVLPAEPIGPGKYPVWSPDSRALAFYNDGLFIMNADGSNPLEIDTGADEEIPFGWSPDGRFIFTKRGTGLSTKLYAVSVSGENEIRLTNYQEYLSSPALSPDGMRIAFHSLRHGGPDIYVMDVRGVPIDANAACLERRLGHTDRLPAWSPDGSKIAFISERDGAPGLYLFDLNEQTSTRLLPQFNVDPTSKPAWSPDGSRLAFAAAHGENGSLEIYTVNLNERQGEPRAVALTQHPAQDSNPVWSSDGNQLAFRSDRDGQADIYLLDLGTQAVSRLTTDGADNVPHGWSPDGTQIVYTANHWWGNRDIYVTNVDGSNKRHLTHSRALDSDPVWSPNGTHIAFASERGGNTELYIMQADGSRETRLTHNTTADASPSWSPDGTRLAFVSLFGICIRSAPGEER